MKRIFAAVAGIITFAILASLIFIYSGVYNVAANNAHWPISLWAIEATRTRSIKIHAAAEKISVPTSLNDESKIIGGAEHYAAHCAVCHRAPGITESEIGDGMYPRPPELTNVSQEYTPAELFWIIKNGIKMSGMPSWADHGDDELWSVVAFLEKFPGMSPDEYKRLVAAASAQPSRHNMDGMNMNGMEMEGMGHDHHHGSADHHHDHGGNNSAPETEHDD